jgi:hypothetical protein
MHVDLASRNVFENSLIGRWGAAYVMMLRQTIDGNRHSYPRNAHPFARNRNYCTCDDHSVNFHFAGYWQHSAQFPVAHQRLTTYERHMQRSMDSYKPHDSIHQIIAPVIAHVAEVDEPPKCISPYA